MRGSAAAAFLLALAAAACGRSGPLDPDAGGTTPTPPPGGFGDGHSGPLHATSGAATLNTCHAVLDGLGSGVDVDDTTGFAVGDAILVWQVQDDFAAASDTAPITTLGSAGLFEVARVASIGALTLETEKALDGVYSTDLTLAAQVCTIPEFTTVTVDSGASLTAEPWDGFTGGVLAFFANGHVQIDGALDATGLGFRGGAPSQTDNGASSDTTTLTSTDDQAGGGKGEGLDARGYEFFARGNIANGAGGGNPQGGGGAGGGNGGAGGVGGDGEGSGNGGVGGIGGRAIVHDTTRLLLPGGGGGGGDDRFGGASAGSAGGGVIFVNCESLTVSATGVLRANGAAGVNSNPGATVAGDGAGGGGAGGMITLTAGSADGAGSILATGGDGGLSVIQGAGNNHRGPGGGGGGGFLSLHGVNGAGLTVSAAGGTRGTNVFGVGLTATGDDHNALDGALGVVVQD